MIMRATGRGAQKLLGLLLAASAATSVSAQPVDPPLPPPRPDRPALPEPVPTSPERSDPARPDGGTTAAGEEGSASQTCRDRLARLGVRFEERPPIRTETCGVEDAVLVSMLPDRVEVKPPALMACPLAEGLARWVLDTVALEADRQLQSAATGLLIGTSYECRSQRSGSKLSEHAFGNGVDIMGFEFARRGPIGVAQHADGSPESAFRAAVQKGACAVFTTVLGPGSDAAHGNHLHLDMRGRKAGYRICQ